MYNEPSFQTVKVLRCYKSYQKVLERILWEQQEAAWAEEKESVGAQGKGWWWEQGKIVTSVRISRTRSALTRGLGKVWFQFHVSDERITLVGMKTFASTYTSKHECYLQLLS